jgi:hypothetical protein
VDSRSLKLPEKCPERTDLRVRARYIKDFIAYKNSNNNINILARVPTQNIFTSYWMFKENIRQVFGDIEQQNTTEKELRYLKQLKLVSEYTAKFQ